MDYLKKSVIRKVVFASVVSILITMTLLTFLIVNNTVNAIKEINEKAIIPTEQPYLEPIQYQELTELPWNEYDIDHALTSKGLEKFAADWNALCE